MTHTSVDELRTRLRGLLAGAPALPWWIGDAEDGEEPGKRGIYSPQWGAFAEVWVQRNDEPVADGEAALALIVEAINALPTLLAALDARPPASDDVEAQRLYENVAANHPTIHCNRFPNWDELSEANKQEYRARAALAAMPSERERIVALEEALREAEESLDQLLDDMGPTGQCVCQQAKEEAVRALAAVRAALGDEK